MPTRAILFGSKLGRASPKGVEGPPPVAQWVFVILGMLLNITGVVLTIIAFVQAINSTTDRSIDDNALRDVARDVCLGLERPVNYGGQINDFYILR